MKTKDKNIKSWLITLVCALVILPICWILITRLESEAPKFDMALPSPFLGVSHDIAFSVSDAKSGLRKIWIGIQKDQKEVPLLDKDFPPGGILRRGNVHDTSFTVQVVPEKLGITDGPAILRLVATDFSWRRWGHGNRTLIEKEIAIDTRRPQIEILSRAHNISPGGSGLIIYKLSESCPTNGVCVGDNFFPGYTGYFKDNTIALAFFALDHNQKRDTAMFIRAVDYAGNTARQGFPYYIRNKVFKKDTLNITDSFLNRKLPEFDGEIQQDSNASLLDRFLIINRELRQENYNTIIAVGRQTDEQIYWQGAFLGLPRSARQAGFADHRSYVYKDRIIDRQVHLGVDLASTEQSPVPAANGGNVTFAGRVGIYGNTVILDHGFGLFSMYSHLNRIMVQTGQQVSKGDRIGHTGITGLAGGDHLHFGMFIHNTFVDPIEWWDSVWIENNIMSKIKEVKSGLGE